MPTMLHIEEAKSPAEWDAFIFKQPWRPFLQSWTMGDVYTDIGQETKRLSVKNEQGEILGIASVQLVHARRGRHLVVPYGPIISRNLSFSLQKEVFEFLLSSLKDYAKEQQCCFMRISPFLEEKNELITTKNSKLLRAPLHILAEHIWYIDFRGKTEESILMEMRKTTRNLIRRAERDGVTIRASDRPNQDIEIFLQLHEETRKRHQFTPYTTAFFRAQVERFSARNECTIYIAEFEGKPIAASIHMHAFGETSYHHGASSTICRTVPGSYLLQWRAIQDALKRGDHLYNFWGIAPLSLNGESSVKPIENKHPFAGVTLFKTGFGGQLLSLQPCLDLPINYRYYVTRAFEFLRKWKRGF